MGSSRAATISPSMARREKEENFSEMTLEQARHLEEEGKREEAIAVGLYTDFIAHHCPYSFEPEGENKALHEKLALAYNNRGFQYYLKVEFQQAVQDYTQALRLDPSLAVAYYNRGLIHYRMSRFSQAVADLRVAVDLKSDLEPAQKCLEQTLRNLELNNISMFFHRITYLGRL